MKTDPNLADPDAFYETLVKAHDTLSESQSAALNARLVLLLANQIGEPAVLLECIEAARTSAAE